MVEVIHTLDSTLLPPVYCSTGTGDMVARYKRYLHNRLYDNSTLRNVLSNHMFTRELCKIAYHEDSGQKVRYRFTPSVDRKVVERFKARETLKEFVRENMEYLLGVSNYHLSGEELKTLKELQTKA